MFAVGDGALQSNRHKRPQTQGVEFDGELRNTASTCDLHTGVHFSTETTSQGASGEQEQKS